MYSSFRISSTNVNNQVKSKNKHVFRIFAIGIQHYKRLYFAHRRTLFLVPSLRFLFFVLINLLRAVQFQGELSKFFCENIFGYRYLVNF